MDLPLSQPDNLPSEARQRCERREPPRDVPYPGVLRLRIDATDTVRGIIAGHLSIPVDGSGPMTLLYPKWMPGYHSPQNPIELLAGLQVTAADMVLDWRRDPTEVY